ncbi:MAG: hypothetical protein ACW980_24560 [Promethearchaeota archaeon]|jgi:hypothetical protein
MKEYKIIQLGKSDLVERFNREKGRDLRLPNFLDHTSSDYGDSEFVTYMINESEIDGWRLAQLEGMTNLLMVREPKEATKGSQEMEWIHDDHYHCKNCQTIIEYKFSKEWNVKIGVLRGGICPNCQTILIETENKGLIWIENWIDLK